MPEPAPKQPEILSVAGPRAKVNRASEHLEALETCLETASKRQPNGVFVEDAAETDEHVVYALAEKFPVGMPD